MFGDIQWISKVNNSIQFFIYLRADLTAQGQLQSNCNPQTGNSSV
jgi:hypothetical protein